VLGLNQSLMIACYFKEDLGQIWQQSNKLAAGVFLADWCGRALSSGIKVLQTMANTLEGPKTGILDWYDLPIISTGRLEGINNKIGALQRMVYGPANYSRDHLRLSHCPLCFVFMPHRTRYQSIGHP
jgi:transposase